jgi:hypothetical protein
VVPAALGAVSLGDAFAGNAATPTVAIVGDSLGWQADASIQTELSQSGYVAQVSVDPGHALSSSWARSELKTDLQDKHFGTIVVETASNDSFQVARSNASLTTYAELLKSLLRAATGRCVVVVNAKVDVSPFYYEPDAALAVNKVISESAQTNSDEQIVDWNQQAQTHGSWFETDQLHFNSQLPTSRSTSDPPSPSSQRAGDRAFARAIVTGIRSCQRLQTI